MALRIGTTLPCSEQRALRCPGSTATGRLQCGQTVWTGCEFVMTRFLCEWALLPIGFVYTAIVPAVQQKLLQSNIGGIEDTGPAAVPGFERGILSMPRLPDWDGGGSGRFTAISG